MEEKIVIAVSGPAGSGKTSHAKKLSETFNLRYVSAGQIFRRIARERGLSLIELSVLAERNPVVDLEVDYRSRMEALKGNVVIEGHLTAWIVRDIADVAIYTYAPLDVRIRRIAEREGKNFKEAFIETLMRERSQAKRFRMFYGIDVYDTSIFDLVIDTSKMSFEETSNIIVSYVKSKCFK